MSSYFLIYFHSEFILSLGSDCYSEYKVTNILAQQLLSILWVKCRGYHHLGLGNTPGQFDNRMRGLLEGKRGKESGDYAQKFQ
jgi:hypothetical protein